MMLYAQDLPYDRPFSCPPEIVLNLPCPPPANKLRKIDWRNHRKHKAWRREAGLNVLVAKSGGRKLGAIVGRFELEITMDEALKCDLDATVKSVADFCVSIGLVRDDGPKYMRKVTLLWGDAAGAIRVTLRGCE